MIRLPGLSLVTGFGLLLELSTTGCGSSTITNGGQLNGLLGRRIAEASRVFEKEASHVGETKAYTWWWTGDTGDGSDITEAVLLFTNPQGEIVFWAWQTHDSPGEPRHGFISTKACLAGFQP